MFCVPPPCREPLQPLLPLPLPVQVVRCWNTAMPAVVPLVGAVILTVALPPIVGAPGLPALFANTIVTPPVRSPMHAALIAGLVVALGGASRMLLPFIVKFEPLLKT